MRSLATIMLASALLSGTAFVDHAEAGDKRKDHRRTAVVHDRHPDGYYTNDRYFRDRDIVVIRDYYRPYYRPLPPGLQRRYYRTGSLPPGWAKRVRPVPIYVDRELVAVPYGYRRGLIDGHAVVYNDRGFILDLAVLF